MELSNVCSNSCRLKQMLVASIGMVQHWIPLTRSPSEFCWGMKENDGVPGVVYEVDGAYGAHNYRQQIQQRGMCCIFPERLDAQKSRLRKGCKGGSTPRFDAKAHKGARSSSVPSS
jgi:hypothetical protein